MEDTHFLLLLFLPLIPLFFLVRSKFSKSPPLPPGPYPWPFIGNLVHMGNHPHVRLAQLAQIHGPLSSLRLGSQLLVVGSSPAAATEILKTHDRELSGRHVPHVLFANSPTDNHVSLGWTFECTDQWKFLRTLCKSELFASKIIEKQSSLREKKAGELVTFLGSKEGEIVKIGEVVFVSVFNFLGQVMFSKDDFMSLDEGENGEISGFIRRLMELGAAPNISDLYPILGGLDLQGLSKKFNVCEKRICSAWAGIVRERREKTKGIDDVKMDTDFLHALLENQFSDDQINHLLLELFAAGTDTSTSTVEWAMAELMKNQEIMNKVREELAQLQIQEGFIKDSHLSSLPYLQACVKETLRLHPPAPLLLPRRATQDCQVMNYTIPRDTRVLVNVWAIARDPNIFEDPLVFRPERFIDSEMDFKGNDFEFLPFGGGRRICPGLPMAIKQVHLTLASLIYHFDWSLPYNMLPHDLDMDEKFGVTLQKLQPLMLIPKQRNRSRS